MLFSINSLSKLDPEWNCFADDMLRFVFVYDARFAYALFIDS